MEAAVNITQAYGATDRLRQTVKHTSPNTKHLRCDGMRCFEVLIRRRKIGTQERYWCDVRRGYFDPASLDHCEKWSNL